MCENELKTKADATGEFCIFFFRLMPSCMNYPSAKTVSMYKLSAKWSDG